jgi:hypothetical protein
LGRTRIEGWVLCAREAQQKQQTAANQRKHGRGTGPGAVNGEWVAAHPQDTIRNRAAPQGACLAKHRHSPDGWHNRNAMSEPIGRSPLALWARWWPFAAVTAVWLVVATQQITLPGVYMDAVDPDYLVVRLLNRHAQPITAWLLDGNYLYGKAPILISFYHGSQQVWLGLPLFALFGISVTGLRLTHAMFGLGILAAMYALLTRAGLKPWQAAMAGIALAVDPGFSYAFRTQSYITLAPTAWLFLSLYALQRTSATLPRPRKWLFASGLFYGFAIVGYFIYAFYLPAMLLAFRSLGRDHSMTAPARAMRSRLALWLGGLAIGGIWYPIGYGLLIAHDGGFREAWSHFQQTQQALGAFGAQTPLLDRAAHIGTMISAVFGNWFHHELIFGERASVPGAAIKLWLLVAAPLVLWLYAEARGRASALLRTLVALPISFAAVATIFGTRLQGHHFVPLLPLAYAALAVALCENTARSTLRRDWAEAGFALAFAGFVGLNVAGQVGEAQRLADTRGVGLFSDAINRFAADLVEMQPKPFLYVPDWGLAMPVAFLTRGTVGMDSIVAIPNARAMLCAGRDVAFAVIDGDRAARVAGWQHELGWSAPVRAAYAQADGKIVFELATFKGQKSGPGCGDAQPG